ncbi:uncharacterized protein LOC134530776 [Bacillus rossius redtenbacheri]|uniref:uncharacterized protein LOC134530776 n=1 Tax=Bacillus rossius redtenbacheri TaxID=93214 RepID=UPI002FDDC9B2
MKRKLRSILCFMAIRRRNVLLVTVPPFRRIVQREKTNELLVKWNGHLRKVVDTAQSRGRRQTVFLVDFGKMASNFPGNYFERDGLHLSGRGLRVLGNCLKNTSRALTRWEEEEDHPRSHSCVRHAGNDLGELDNQLATSVMGVPALPTETWATADDWESDDTLPDVEAELLRRGVISKPCF